jgi:Rod binding domain-containing protein
MEGLSLDPRALYSQIKMKQDFAPRKTTESFGNLMKVEGIEDKAQKKLELKKACQAMEAVFTEQMLKEMRKTVHKTKLIDGGFAEEVFSDMLYTEYAQKMAENSESGIASMMYKSLEHTI